jgi:chemotaxis protein CheD
MNHFLLPEARNGSATNVKYGAFLMELLVNDLLKAGAKKSRMSAKLYGGSKMNAALGDVGDRNILFARRYLENEGITLEMQDVGGSLARRISMWPAIGKVDVRLIQGDSNDANETVLAPRKVISDVVLF